MDLSVVLVFAVVFCLSMYVLKRHRNLPPGPFSVPVFGSIFFLQQINKVRPHLFVSKAAKKYGDVMSFYVGPQLVVALSGYDTVHEALVKQAGVFSGRPGNFQLVKRMFEEDGNKSRGLLNNQYGHSWRFNRRFALQALRDSGVGKSSLEDKVLTEIGAVCTRLERLEGQCLNIRMYLTNLIGNVLNGIVFGKRYEYEDEEFRTVAKLLQLLATGEFNFTLSNYLPEFVVRLVNRKMADNDRRMILAVRELRRYVLNHVEDHRATFDENHIRDLVDLSLKAASDGSGKDREAFEEEEMFRVIMDLFMAGTDTIATALDWAVLYMCEYPSVQKACQKEVTEVVGDNPIRYADRLKLVYTEAALLEVQRISCIAPFAVPHCTLEDTTLHGYTIPKNTMILPSLYSACYDPKYWENPSEFRPERFIGDDGKVIKHEAMIPFSTGPRQCVGEPLAKLELFLVFANLLQRFTFEPADKTVKHSMESRMNYILNSPKPYKIRVFKRK